MAKIVLNNISNIQNDQSAVSTINSNYDAIEAAIDQALFRNGLTPNQMEATLDMNSNRIINLPEPFFDHEAVKKEYVDGIIEGLVMGEIPTEAIEDAVNEYLAGGTPPAYSDLTTALANTPEGATFITVAGYVEPGDKGAAIWKNIGTEPSDSARPRYREAANGEWYEIAMATYTPQMFGAVGDGVEDDTDACVECLRSMQEDIAEGIWTGTFLVDDGAMVWTNISGTITTLQGAGGTFGTYTGGVVTVSASGYASVAPTISNDSTTDQVIAAFEAISGSEYTYENVGGQILVSALGGTDLTISGDSTLLTTIGFAIGNRTSTNGDVGTEEPGPTMYTSDCTFVSAGTADAPMLTVQCKQPFQFITNGYIGSMNFVGTRGANSNRHGLSMSGVQGITLGYLFADQIQGSVLHFQGRGGELEAQDSDYFHVGAISCIGVENYRGNGWALLNEVAGQGANGCYFGLLRSVGQGSIASTLGAWKGAGAANICDLVSIGSTQGYAIDWDTTNELAGGTHKCTIVSAELDGPEYGIKIDNFLDAKMQGVRFVHRSNDIPGFELLYPAGEVWPKTCISLGAEADESCQRIDIQCVHRLAIEIVEGDMAASFPWVQFNSNERVTNVRIEHWVIENHDPPVVLARSVFGGNIDTQSPEILIKAHYIQEIGSVNVTINEVVYDSRVPSHYIRARMESSDVPILTSTNWTLTSSSNNPVTFAQYDRSVYNPLREFSSTTYQYTVPYTGWWHVRGKVTLGSTATRVRSGVFAWRSSAVSGSSFTQFILSEEIEQLSGSTISHTSKVDYYGPLSAGDLVGVAFDTNSTSTAIFPQNVSAGQPNNNTLLIRPIQYSEW